MEKNSGPGWRLALASFLTYLAIPLGCSAGYGLGTAWTGVIADRSEQVVVDDAHPLRASIAIVASPAGASDSAGMIYGSVRDPERDVASFRLKHAGYSFVPPADRGHISLQEAYVDYQVVRRDSGKALIKTHYDLHAIGLSSDIRATYEATESGIRLISYRLDCDNGCGILAGSMLALALGLLARALQKRFAASSAPSKLASSRLDYLRRIARALTFIALLAAVVSIAASWALVFVAALALLLLAALLGSFLRTLESPRPAREAK